MSAKFSRSVSPRISQRPFGQCAAFAGEQPRAPARLLRVIATPRQFSSLQCWHFGDLTAKWQERAESISACRSNDPHRTSSLQPMNSRRQGATQRWTDDVCEWWTRDGLTVETAFRKPDTTNG